MRLEIMFRSIWNQFVIQVSVFQCPLAFIIQNQYDSAIFWAELLFNKSGGCGESIAFENFSVSVDSLTDLYLYLKALFHNGQFRRVIDLVDRCHLAKVGTSICGIGGDLVNRRLQKFLTLRLLAARCYFAIKDGIGAILMLDCQCAQLPTAAARNCMGDSNSGGECLMGLAGFDSQEAALFGESQREVRFVLISSSEDILYRSVWLLLRYHRCFATLSMTIGHWLIDIQRYTWVSVRYWRTSRLPLPTNVGHLSHNVVK